MTQATHFAAHTNSRLRARRASILHGSLVLAAAAVVAVVLAFTLGGSDVNAPSSIVSDQPAVRFDGGSSKGAVSASVGSRPRVRPSESSIAAAIGVRVRKTSARPDESRIAAAVWRHPPSASTGGAPAGRAVQAWRPRRAHPFMHQLEQLT